jgi:imidazolonepropionase-like amidohydrolase
VHPLIIETVRPEQIRRLQARFPLRNSDERARARTAWDKLAAGIKRLSDAGVAIGTGTDGGGQQGDQFIGWTMHTELENLVMAGIPSSNVLVAATKTAAAILGLDDLGMVAPGKSADFVVLDANPLDDITNTRRIAAVYLRGRAVDRAGLRNAWTH